MNSCCRDAWQALVPTTVCPAFHAAVQVGSYIKARGGVVTADELAPYLDPPAQVGRRF